jgi:hypothetical protein
MIQPVVCISNSLSSNTFPCLTTFPDSKSKKHGRQATQHNYTSVADNFCRLHVAIAVKNESNGLSKQLFHIRTDGLKNSIHDGN